MVGELVVGKDVGRSAIIGVGAAKGRAYGTVLKMAFGFAIVMISLVVSIPWPSRDGAAAAAHAIGKTH